MYFQGRNRYKALPFLRIHSHTHRLGQSSDEVFADVSLVAVTDSDA